jgi:methionine-rich copper-binding protein CopC
MLRPALAILFAVSPFAGPATADAPARVNVHLALERSEPAADAEVQTVPGIFVWFTQAPQENSVSLRLIDSDGSLVDIGDLERDGDDPKAFEAAVEGALDPGAYTVAWRAMGDDGHVVRGEFTFTVRAE